MPYSLPDSVTKMLKFLPQAISTTLSEKRGSEESLNSVNLLFAASSGRAKSVESPV
jgi:hypothetical protein